MSAEREMMLGFLIVDLDHMLGKAAKGGCSQTLTSGQEEAVQWARLYLIRPAFGNGPVHPLPCGEKNKCLIGRIIASKSVHNLIPRNCDYVGCVAKRNEGCRWNSVC